ncbi:hypothetical protein [Devosia sp. Root105]|uniref:hypothetical protein n=1 Tax=Devosia sp. Root105 TaxID=1736423 RepID=UPI0006F7AF43|nr:hypothetical protein [Devosia sp. Root105]KQU96447.1 hypothetical protein ASC68_13800 [Devosia sp. Root105]
MSKTVRVNVRAVANVAAVRKEKRNGRDVVIVPSATMPDDIIMNGSQGKVLYPADEIAKSFKQLERTPAPLGHPMINGKFVSARDPEGINIGHIGAWNENVRQEGGRVLLDKVIDVEVANRSEGGKAVLAAIDAGGPIHTSTGLLAHLEDVTNSTSHQRVARAMVFDHDAILLNEEGAATPEQGVGMLVNAQGETEEIEVINSSLEGMDQEIDWAGTRLIEAVRRKADASKWQELKDSILKALGLDFTEREPTTNRKEAPMETISKEQFDALSKKVDTLSEGLGRIGDTVGTAVANAMKPLVDAQNSVIANQKAKDDEELKGLREKIVKANLLDEASAGELTLNAARALAKQAEPGKAATLNGAFKGPTQPAAFKLPKAEA